jgi:uncharacterized protein (DUF488 family)
VALFTIGHSTRSIDEFLDLLRIHRIQRIIDVRTVPRSRRHPHFSQEALRESVVAAGIGYAHMPELGGLRKPRRDSVNTAWRNEGFRGFADHMRSAEFEAGLQGLIGFGETDRVAVMCAEAVPWKCHRSLIADALVARGVPVAHIVGADAPRPHRLDPTARVDGERVTYPGPPNAEQLEL